MKMILSHFGAEVLFLEAMGAVAIGAVAGAASFVPAGIGVNEAVQAFFLVGIGVEESIAIVAVFVGRVCTLWLALVVGGLSIALLDHSVVDSLAVSA